MALFGCETVSVVPCVATGTRRREECVRAGWPWGEGVRTDSLRASEVDVNSIATVLDVLGGFQKRFGVVAAKLHNQRPILGVGDKVALAVLLRPDKDRRVEHGREAEVRPVPATEDAPRQFALRPLRENTLAKMAQQTRRTTNKCRPGPACQSDVNGTRLDAQRHNPYRTCSTIGATIIRGLPSTCLKKA